MLWILIALMGCTNDEPRLNLADSPGECYAIETDGGAMGAGDDNGAVCVYIPPAEDRADFPHCCPDDQVIRCLNHDGASVCGPAPEPACDTGDTGGCDSGL